MPLEARDASPGTSDATPVAPAIEPGPLPMRLAWAPDESFASYVTRLAARYRVTLHTMLHTLGLLSPGQDTEGFGLWLDELGQRRFCRATGTDPEHVADALLTRYDGTVADLSGLAAGSPSHRRSVAAREWVYIAGSMLCPHCLAAHDGAYKLAWKLPFSFACVEHRCLLIDRCPGCELQPLSVTRERRTRLAFPGRIPELGRCSNRNGRGQFTRGAQPCGYELTTAPATGLGADSPVLAAQALLDPVLAGQPTQLLGSEVSAARFLHELQALTRILLQLAEADDLPSLPGPCARAFAAWCQQREADDLQRRQTPGRRGPTFRVATAPRETALLAAVLPIATDTLHGVQSEAELGARLAWLGERLRERVGARTHEAALSRRHGLTPLLARALGDARWPSWVPGSHRSARPGDTFTPSTIAGGSRLDSRLVPQLLWEQVTPRFAPFFDDRYEWPWRMFVSLALVRVSQGARWDAAEAKAGAGRAGDATGPDDAWRQAADTLGMAEALAEDLRLRMVWRFAREGTADAFGSELRRLHAHLAAGDVPGGLIDWRARQAAFAAWDDFGDQTWERLRTGPAVTKMLYAGNVRRPLGSDARGLGIRTGSRRLAAVWLWGRLTGQRPTDAPASAGRPAESEYQLYVRFSREVLPMLRDELLVVERELLAAHGLAGRNEQRPRPGSDSALQP